MQKGLLPAECAHENVARQLICAINLHMDYGTLKALHVALAAMVGALLVLRLLLALRSVNYRRLGALRWVPHLIDTSLLLTAVALVWWSRQYPFVEVWLTAKLLLLPPYIIAAAMALDPTRSKAVRIVTGFASCLVLAYIVSVAITRQIFPW